MEEAPENGKESSHSAHANGMNEVSSNLDKMIPYIYDGHLESKEHFAIKKYFLIIGKKRNMQVLLHTFTYFST